MKECSVEYFSSFIFVIIQNWGLMKKLVLIQLFWVVFVLPILYAQEENAHLKYSDKIALPLLNQKNTHFPQTLRLKTNVSSQVMTWIHQNYSTCQLLEATQDSTILLVEIYQPQTLEALLQNPAILFIDKGTRPAHEERANDLTGFRVNRVGALQSTYPQLTGEGLRVSIKEGAFDKNDIDFRGRVAQFDNFPTNITTHATEMASLVAGGGNSSPLGKGVAWEAQLFTDDFANLMPRPTQYFVNQGISVQNHSYGVGIENYYGIETQAFDQQANVYPELLHVFSAGNAGNQASQEGNYVGITGFANLTAQFKMSKNTLSIGEINQDNQLTALSSRGPAYDGRIKPELVAYSGAGTSESAALVSGVALLLQQAYQMQFSVLPKTSALKALLINSAEDLGRPHPDFEYGFGKMNALKAVESLTHGQLIEDQLQANQEKTYFIQVPEDAPLLKITLVWNDPEAALNATTALINDLDLSLTYTESNQTWLPWVLNNYPHIDSLTQTAKRSIDRLNNIEQITLAAPRAGEYAIKVKGFSLQTLTQEFSLVCDYSTENRWLYPNRNDFVIANRTLMLEWEAPAQAGTIAWKYTGEEDWQTLANLEDVSVGNFSYLLPDTLALTQFRIQTPTLTLLSDTILLSKPIVPRIGFDCPEEVLLFWSPLQGIGQYEVLQMGSNGLVLFATVNDTLLVINKNTVDDVFFAVAPVFEGRNPRGLTLNYTFQGVDCYIRSLLLREVVSDTILLDLSLGTNYELAFVALQRQEQGSFRTLSIQNNPNSLLLTFEDSSPLNYRNLYRVELTTYAGQKFYSNEVEAFFIPENEFLLYPNPARISEVVLILDAEEQITQARIFDTRGRLLKSIHLANQFKEIYT